MLRATGASVIGPGHLQACTPNQDAMRVGGVRGGWFAAVADGLGSRELSHIGSRLAVQQARRAWSGQPDAGYARDAEETRASIRRLYESWLRAIPAAPPGRYATTLLAASCDADGACCLAQLGDGLIVYRTAGRFGVLGEAPHGLRSGFGNETEALGVTKSFSAWRTDRVALIEPGDGVMLMTDGIADDLRPERLEAFFSHVLEQAGRRSRRAGRRWLERQMNAWPTALHSDDKSIALIFLDKK
jgi:serine/threonine protein phosphatase PrpC